MFDVISTAKSTQWSSFPTLCTKHSYSHVANESVDFQVIPGKNCFAEFNKKFGFELLRTINKDGKDIIQRIKKRQVDDLSCGSISKIRGGEIALGLTSGYIRFFNVETADFLPYKFKPGRIGDSVIGLEYSSTDDYLAVVYESADINLFGLKTGVKIDTFRLDKQSTMIRFHPAKQFALAIGSFEGAITMLDIQTKKKLFSEKLAHSAPVRDISMFESAPDVLVSCGYDCYINIFDIRKRSVVLQYQQDHPMSTVCVSPCGTFCVGGNLKGDIISYDFRNMKDPIDTKRAHDSAVVRVAFVPSAIGGPNTTLDHIVSSSSLEVTAATSSMSASRRTSGRTSFDKFVDVCHYNNVATPEDATPKPKRNSWLDLAPAKRCHDFSMDSIAETPSRMSFGGNSHSVRENSFSLPSRISLIQSIVSDTASSECNTQVETTVPENPPNKSTKLNEQKEKPVVEPKRRRMTDVVALEGIEEEVSEVEKEIIPKNKMWLHNVDHTEFANAFAAFVKKNIAADDAEGDNHLMKAKQNENTEENEEDKENRQSNQQCRGMNAIEMSLTSTPNGAMRNFGERAEMVTINTAELNKILADALNEKFNMLESKFETQMRQWQENLLSYSELKYKELTTQVRYMQGRYFQSDFNMRYKNHMELEEELDLFDEGFAALLHTDTVQDQYPVYSAEVEELRRKFHEQQSLNRR